MKSINIQIKKNFQIVNTCMYLSELGIKEFFL